MTVRFGLSTRVGLGVRACAGFRWSQLPNLELELRADLGIAKVDAAIVGGSNMAGAAWSRTNSPAAGADTVADTNDTGTPKAHYINQAGGVVVNVVGSGAAEFKAGTKTWVYYSAPNGVNAYLNLTTGALGTVVGGTANVVDAGGGWWRLILEGVCTSAQAAVIGPASGDGGLSYAGDGTGTILCRNVTITQRRVNSWTDQSVNGYVFTPTGFSPAWIETDADMNGRAIVRFNQTPANQLRNHVAALAGIFSGSDKPCTVFWVHRLRDNVTTRWHVSAYNTATAARWDVIRTGATTTYVTNKVADDTTSTVETLASAPTLVRRIITFVCHGTTVDWYSNGVLVESAQPFNAAVTTLDGMAFPGLEGNNSVNADVGELVIYSRALTAPELALGHAHLGARYAL